MKLRQPSQISAGCVTAANRWTGQGSMTNIRAVPFLEQSVKQSTARHLIVATHHVPSFELMAPEFKGSPLNGAFTVELGGFIADSPIEYWIYGHSHRNINKVIGNTRCICNQLGYVFSNEHTSFDKEAHISI